MSLDGRRIGRREHFERDGGPPAGSDHRTENSGLQLVMIGIVVFLAEHHELRAADTLVERPLVDEPRVPHVPDSSDERVIAIELALPPDPRASDDRREHDETVNE